jgi:hypothetical protein
METLPENTFAFVRTVTTGFDRDVGKLKGEVEQDAVKFCAEKGKVMRVLSVTGNRPHFGGGFTSAKIIFQALDANDPALHEPLPPAPGSAAAQYAGPPTGTLPTYAGDLYSEILKLEDLRKRGLLTDKEFAQQKKKLLKNAK